MPEKEMVGVRLPADTLQQVEQYAEEHDLSKSDALRRMIEKGIDLEEAGLTVAASHQPEETEDEKEVVADGGQVVRPIFNMVGAIYAVLSLGIFVLMALAAFDTLRLGFLDYTEVFSMMVSSLLVVAVVMVFLYSGYPERIDQVLYSGVRRISRLRTSMENGT